MLNLVKRIWNDESGQGMVEYGLILALVAVAAVVALGAIGGKLTPMFQSVADKITPVPTPAP